MQLMCVTAATPSPNDASCHVCLANIILHNYIIHRQLCGGTSQTDRGKASVWKDTKVVDAWIKGFGELIIIDVRIYSSE